MKNTGFTLIELLVVVLIIGILAAVALPQYQTAVEKSRAGTLLPVGRALATAEEVYFMANGKYTGRFEDLAVQVPSGWSKDRYDRLRYPDGSIIYLGPAEMGYIALSTKRVQFDFMLHHHPDRPNALLCYAPQSDKAAMQVCATGGPRTGSNISCMLDNRCAEYQWQ